MPDEERRMFARKASGGVAGIEGGRKELRASREARVIIKIGDSLERRIWGVVGGTEADSAARWGLKLRVVEEAGRRARVHSIPRAAVKKEIISGRS